MNILIASHNSHKIEELSRILAACGVQAVTADELGVALTEPEETGKTFAENARIKAKAACLESGLAAVADDSGLCVDALDGAPGIYSARYAPAGQRKATLLKNLGDRPKHERTARFIASICCYLPNGDTVTADGVCEGFITSACRGESGFGYDPIFEVEGGKTFAELSPAEKDKISHRGHALKAFSARLSDYLTTHKEEQP